MICQSVDDYTATSKNGSHMSIGIDSVLKLHPAGFVFDQNGRDQGCTTWGPTSMITLTTIERMKGSDNPMIAKTGQS